MKAAPKKSIGITVWKKLMPLITNVMNTHYILGRPYKRLYLQIKLFQINLVKACLQITKHRTYLDKVTEGKLRT